MTEIKKTTCSNCSSKSIRKFGIQKNKLQTHQKYFCNNCQKIFTLQKQKNKSYSIQTILKAITLYNLGHSQFQIQKLIKTNPKPSQKTISNWINEFKTIATYSRLRAKSQDSDTIIENHTFMHNNLPYKFQIHNYKTRILTKNNEKFQKIKFYLEKIPTVQFPNYIFTPKQSTKQELDRSSQTKFKTKNINLEFSNRDIRSWFLNQFSIPKFLIGLIIN